MVGGEEEEDVEQGVVQREFRMEGCPFCSRANRNPGSQSGNSIDSMHDMIGKKASVAGKSAARVPGGEMKLGDVKLNLTLICQLQCGVRMTCYIKRGYCMRHRERLRREKVLYCTWAPMSASAVHKVAESLLLK